MRIPKELTAQAAQDYWRRNAPLCERMGTLGKADLDTFILLCGVWAKLHDTAETDTIRWVCLAKQYQQLAKLFGLDPVSRKKLGVSLDEPHDDELDYFGN